MNIKSLLFPGFYYRSQFYVSVSHLCFHYKKRKKNFFLLVNLHQQYLLTSRFLAKVFRLVSLLKSLCFKFSCFIEEESFESVVFSVGFARIYS
jgi:hypothetical protein